MLDVAEIVAGRCDERIAIDLLEGQLLLLLQLCQPNGVLVQSQPFGRAEISLSLVRKAHRLEIEEL